MTGERILPEEVTDGAVPDPDLATTEPEDDDD